MFRLLCMLFFFQSAFSFFVTPFGNIGRDAASLESQLRPRLSPGASITRDSTAAPRWSDFQDFHPGLIVNVATENDVVQSVRFCNEKRLTFVAQNGASNWATTFHIGQNDVVINLRGLNDVVFNSAKTKVTFQGGTTISELVGAAYNNNAQVPTGNCDCVGTLGAVLGGGYGRLMGLYGFGVDNLLSVNLVTAAGVLKTVDSRNSDLWWALRGAGANFGIVTSATMKSYPVPQSSNIAWLGPLIFTEDKLEALVRVVGTLTLQPRMALFMYFASSGPPDFHPTLIALPFYVGDAAAGKQAFAPLLALGPVADQTAVFPYNQWNAGSGPFCVKGERKPSFGAGLATMNPATWRSVWNEYVKFLKIPGTGQSVVLLEAYSMQKARSIPESSSSFPLRNTVNFNAVAIPWYSDASIDPQAVAFGSKVRDLLRSTDGLAYNSTYINFAFGDERLETVYGKNVARLKQVKSIYDPLRRFNQFFGL